MNHSFGSAEEVDHVRILQSCNSLLLCTGLAWLVFYYVYNPSINLFKRFSQPNYSHDDSRFYSSVLLRMAFDPRKLLYYKVVQAERTSETRNKQLKHFKLNIEDRDNEIISSIQIPHGLHRGRNFLRSFGDHTNDPILLLMKIPQMLHLEEKFFESRGCLLLVCKDYIGSREFTIYEMLQGCSVWSVSRSKIPNLDPPAGIFANDLRSLFECDFLPIDSRLNSKISTMDHSFGSAEEVDHARILMTFDPGKSLYYKVVQAGRTSGETHIQIYSLETEGLNRQLKHYKLNIEDHEHPIMTTFKIPHGLHRGRNFLESISGCSDDPILLLMEIPHMLHLEGKFFKSCGCMLLVCRNNIGSRDFTIYEMMKGCFVWTVRSNQMGDDDDVEFILPFSVDPNHYEFIPSLASV
ncbi:hypothetical protein Tco_0501811 [Tanacetum coccineum]